MSGRREVREQDEVSPDDQLPPHSVSCLQGQYHFILKAAGRYLSPQDQQLCIISYSAD